MKRQSLYSQGNFETTDSNMDEGDFATNRSGWIELDEMDGYSSTGRLITHFRQAYDTPNRWRTNGIA